MINLDPFEAGRRQQRGARAFARVLALAAAACLSGCSVLPKNTGPEVSAVAIYANSFMGLKVMAAASEIRGELPAGPVRSVARCRAVAAGDEVRVELLSYEGAPSAWCEHDRLAGVFAAVLEQIGLYAGVIPPIRKLTLRIIPTAMSYQRTRWSLGRDALHLDVALSEENEETPRVLTESVSSPDGSNAGRLERAFVRWAAHELFHAAVAFSGRRLREDFQSSYANELAAYLLEPCVELAILGNSRGGRYHDGHRGFSVEGYPGDRDPLPSGAAHLNHRKQAFYASVLASIRSERLLDEITGERWTVRADREADAVVATCRTAVQTVVGEAR